VHKKADICNNTCFFYFLTKKKANQVVITPLVDNPLTVSPLVRRSCWVNFLGKKDFPVNWREGRLVVKLIDRLKSLRCDGRRFSVCFCALVLLRQCYYWQCYGLVCVIKLTKSEITLYKLYVLYLCSRFDICYFVNVISLIQLPVFLLKIVKF
jgi:hypothetical protein